MQADRPDDRGFRLSEGGATFCVNGSERVDVRRYRTISIDRPVSPNRNASQSFVAAIYQHSDQAGEFIDPPFVDANFDRMPRAEWEAFKREVDRAFDEFERRWPASAPRHLRDCTGNPCECGAVAR